MHSPNRRLASFYQRTQRARRGRVWRPAPQPEFPWNRSAPEKCRFTVRPINRTFLWSVNNEVPLPSIEKQIAQLHSAISAQETLRPTLGDGVVEVTLKALRTQLDSLLAEQKDAAQPKP